MQRHFNFDEFKTLQRSQRRELPKPVRDILKKTSLYRIENNEVVPGSSYTFSHDLIRIRNEWYVINPAPKGAGAFGSVADAPYRITGNDIIAEENVVKRIKLPPDSTKHATIKSMVDREALLLKKHRVEVKGILSMPNDIYIVMYDCGVTLDKIFPHNSLSFHERLAILLRLCNEMQLLKTNNIIHRDLKPQNICYKKRGDTFDIIFIDFGLAVMGDEKVNTLAGTINYMAPEMMFGAPSFKSDIYALAGIMLLILGATNILKLKREEFNKSKSNQRVTQQLFSEDGIYSGYDIPASIDSDLRGELRDLIARMQSINPDDRPNIDFITKFLVLVSQREQCIKAFKQHWDSFERTLTQAINIYDTFGIHPDTEQFIGIQDQKLGSIVSLKATAKELQKLRNGDLVRYQPTTHLEITQRILASSELASSYADYFPIPNIRPMQAIIQRNILQLTNIQRVFTEMERKIRHGDAFLRLTNSGIQQMKEVLASNDPILSKLRQLQTIATERLEPSFFNWCTHLSIFGRDRHPDIERLYQLINVVHRNVIEHGNETIDELTGINLHIQQSSLRS